MVVAQAVAAIALGLLGASGVVKLIDPDPTTGAMGAAGLPASRLLTRLLGAFEIASGVVGLAYGGIALVLSALLYLGFTVFTVLALRGSLALQSCGCFGREDTPPSGIHVVYNAFATASLMFLSLAELGPIEWAVPIGELTLYLGWLALGVFASFLVLTRLPQVLVLARSS